MSDKLFNSKNWVAKRYKIATELENFINFIREKFIDKKIDKIMVMGLIFNSAERF